MSCTKVRVERDGQQGQPMWRTRKGRKVGNPSAKQEEPGVGSRQRERRGRQEGLHPLPAGVVGPPYSEQQDVTSGAWELGALAVVLGRHSQMDGSGQVGPRRDFLA